MQFKEVYLRIRMFGSSWVYSVGVGTWLITADELLCVVDKTLSLVVLTLNAMFILNYTLISVILTDTWAKYSQLLVLKKWLYFVILEFSWSLSYWYVLGKNSWRWQIQFLSVLNFYEVKRKDSLSLWKLMSHLNCSSKKHDENKST